MLVHVKGLADLEAIETMAKAVLAKGRALLGPAGVTTFGDFQVNSAEAVEPIAGFVEDPDLTHGVLTDADVDKLKKEFKKVRRCVAPGSPSRAAVPRVARRPSLTPSYARKHARIIPTHASYPRTQAEEGVVEEFRRAFERTYPQANDAAVDAEGNSDDEVPND